jgi:PAS domain S-box-containing protein
MPPVSPEMVSEGAFLIDSHRLLIVEPILLSETAEGAIVLNYPASTFEKLFGDPTHPQALFVVGYNGLVVYSTNATLASEGELNEGESIEGWLQARTSLPQSNLSVILASSLEAAFKPLETVQLVQLVGLLVFLSVSTGLVLLSMFIVSRPLEKFTTAISGIKSVDDLGRRLDTKGPREIAEIASTFNRMGDWLQSTTVSRNYMDKIFGSVTEGIITIDDRGLIMTYNNAAAKLFGYDSSEIIGQNVSILMPSDEREAHDTYLKKTQLHMPRIIGQNRVLQGYRKDGSLFPMELTVTPLEQEGRQGFVGTIRDITERSIIEKRLERRSDELKRTNKELERFVYVASHDLKAPMRGIDNLATWIEQDLEGKLDEETQENLTLLRGRVHRMEDLLDGLLEYSRVGRVATKSETIDTRELVTDIVDLLALPKGFSVDMPGPMPVITTEKVSLQQVFRNLINNAVKHHDRSEGCITITGTGNNGTFEFSVSDDGAGIDPEFHERVFTMFQTLKPRDEVEGSGMGLALVKKEVELHGGKVEIDSNGDTRGTTFRFSWKGNSVLPVEQNLIRQIS